MSTAAKPETGRAVATVDQKRQTLTELFSSEDALKYITPFLPEGADVKRVVATVLLAIKMDQTGALKKCSPESLVIGVARIQQWGLELGTTAHLLPFKGIAVPVADYKGLAELMVASGAVRYVEAHAVYEGDEFTYRLGLEPKIDHVPATPRAKGAKITFAYCILHLPFARFAFDVMSADDIDDIRQRYSKQWKEGPLPAWYAKKTVVRQVAKLVPKNPRLAKALLTMEQERSVEFEMTPGSATLPALRDEDEITVPQGALMAGDGEEAEPIPYMLSAEGAEGADDDEPLASPKQKTRILALLDVADINDARRVELATEAGKPTCTFKRAHEIIAHLARLVPQGAAE